MLRVILPLGMLLALAACFLPVWERYENTGAVYTYEGQDYRVIRGHAVAKDGPPYTKLLLFPAEQDPKTYDGRFAAASCDELSARACETTFGTQLRAKKNESRAEEGGMGY